MISFINFCVAVVVASTSLVSAHISIWHESMWGFNVTNGLRPQDPLINLPFSEWWFHGHLPYPPHPNDIMQLPVGEKVMTELSCDKDVTSWWASGPGGDRRDPNNPDYPCPGQPTTQFHTNGINDLGGCALAVAYKSDVNDVQPEDFVVFSVNQKCVWNLHTYFEIPADMPACSDGKCICAWFWVHKADSGSEQNYMTGFQCNFKNAVSKKTLGTPKVPRRCGPDASNNFTWNRSNCTYGPKQPFYWFQKERNNMFEGTYTPPLYLDEYNFLDGAQNDIFVNSTNANSTDANSTDVNSSISASGPAASTTMTGTSSASALPNSGSTSGTATQSMSMSPSKGNVADAQPSSSMPSSSSSLSHGSDSTTPPDGYSPSCQTQTNAARATVTAAGTSDPNNNSGNMNDQQTPDHGHCNCNHHHHGGSNHWERSTHHSRNYHRDSGLAEDNSLRRAWGSHRRGFN